MVCFSLGRHGQARVRCVVEIKVPYDAWIVSTVTGVGAVAATGMLGSPTTPYPISKNAPFPNKKRSVQSRQRPWRRDVVVGFDGDGNLRVCLHGTNIESPIHAGVPSPMATLANAPCRVARLRQRAWSVGYHSPVGDTAPACHVGW